MVVNIISRSPSGLYTSMMTCIESYSTIISKIVFNCNWLINRRDNKLHN